MKTNQVASFHIHIKRNLKHFGSNEIVKIYSLKKICKYNITKTNQTYHRYVKITTESPVNQPSETATAVREIVLFKKTCLTHNLGFLFSLFLHLSIIINIKSLCRHFHFCVVNISNHIPN